MTSEVNLDVVEGISETLQATTLSEKDEVDHLSGLPGELLDDIFEVAARTSWPKLTSRPISKSLLPSQERAIYETISVGPGAWNYLRLVRTLDARPDKSQHTRKLVWRFTNPGDGSIDSERLVRHLPNLSEIDFELAQEAIARPVLRQYQHLPSLRTCRLRGLRLTSSIVSCLSRIPTLRLVEIPSLPNKEEEKKEWSPARQVLQITIHQRGNCFVVKDPSTLLRFFPSACISSLDVHVDRKDPVSPLLGILGPGLLRLRLRASTHSISECDTSIVRFLPRFPNLQHLHLDSPFISESLLSHLLNLPNLTSLSLAYFEQTPDVQELLEKSDRLPRLRILDLEYRFSDTGRIFDFEDAEEEYDRGDDYKGRRQLYLLEGVTVPAQMEDWQDPWYETILERLPQAIETEKKARAAGLVIRSNLSSLIQIFESRILECYNRAVGDYYFNGRKLPLRYVLPLAKRHGLDIDRLEIDPERNYENQDLEWFQVEVDKVGSLKWCYVYGLRVKGSTERSDSVEEEEEEEGEQENCDESDQGSAGSEVY
ncbi:uncharacterized protein JCM6883_005588 [Sporobolomyces salmoneus]|uniref:uncharacterized protein n=1 Tax=Sporobolomyces salmoneus TaxID=183962 RepID=UPI00318181FE